MATPLTFKDLNITFKKHPVTNDIVVSRDESAIKQAIVNLLLTNKGERLMNPKYGSDIRSYLFEPLDFGTAAQIKSSITYCLKSYEPRIEVLNLECRPNFDENGFSVELQYEIRGSENPPVVVDFFLARTR